MKEMNQKIEDFLTKNINWQDELRSLRTIILESNLTEELKWGVPCYSYKKGNVVLIHSFKEYCAILFVKGSLLKDKLGILVQQTENVPAARQIRFKSVREVHELKEVLKEYIDEAIENEKSGLKVPMKKTSDYKIPEEFQIQLDQNPILKSAFEALTPGRQRAYLFHFSSPKQSKTREARVEKCINQILNGKGLDD